MNECSIAMFNRSAAVVNYFTIRDTCGITFFDIDNEDDRNIFSGKNNRVLCVHI